MLRGLVKFPDPSDASDDPYGGVDLIHHMAGGFVDERGSKGRVSSESKRNGTHSCVVGNQRGQIGAYICVTRNSAVPPSNGMMEWSTSTDRYSLPYTPNDVTDGRIHLT